MSRQNCDRQRFAPIRPQEFCTQRRIAKGEEDSFKTKWRATKIQEVIKRPSKIMTKDAVESVRAPVKHCFQTMQLFDRLSNENRGKLFDEKKTSS